MLQYYVFTAFFSSLRHIIYYQPTAPSISNTTSPTIIYQRGVPHVLLLAMALLSWSLLSADTEVFDPSDPQFPARWRCPYIYVQYGTCLVVYVYVRLLLACGPGLLSGSTTQYQSLGPTPPPTISSLSQPSPSLAASTWKYAQQLYCPTHSKIQHGTWAAFIAWECVCM